MLDRLPDDVGFEVAIGARPIPFLTGMKRGGARGFDAYAHHPYYGSPSESPSDPPKSKTAIRLGNINVLIATGLILFVVTFAVNFIARWIVNRRKEFSGAD